MLFLYVVLLICPIRHWAIKHDIDSTWVFAMNYAHTHGLTVGKDVVFTVGPLSWLVLPQALDNNLTYALIFQVVVWIVQCTIFADLFFRSGLSLSNIAAFTTFFALSSPLFWFNRLGMENQLLASVLVLLVLVRLRGGTARYVTALILIGVIPLIKLTGGFIAAGALAGFLIDRAICLRWKALSSIILAAVVPLATAGIAFYVAQHSLTGVGGFLKGSLAISENYSVAQSMAGSEMDFVAGAETMILLGALLLLLASVDRRAAVYYVMLLALPLFISIKHGFIRQDYHVSNFFCFAALAMALVSLWLVTDGWRGAVLLLVAAPFFIIWQDYVANWRPPTMAAEITGVRTAVMIFEVLRGHLTARLEGIAEQEYPQDARVEPEIRALVGAAPVASLSVIYADLHLDKMNLRIYPVVQRYSAYTPYLDELNAVWVKEQGPRFLLFDGKTIDNRQLWAETPATWLEVYRWYNKKALGPRNLLLERRTIPRFTRLELLKRFQTPSVGELAIPPSDTPVFWTRSCPLNLQGRVRKLLFRIPSCTLGFPESAAAAYRIVPEVLTAPVMGTYLPNSLQELADLFTENALPKFVRRKLTFSDDGNRFYGPACSVEILRPVQ